MVSALQGPTAHWETKPSRYRVVCVAVDLCTGAESSPARLGEEGPSGDFLETQKPKLNRKRLSGSWAGKEVEKGVPGRRNSASQGLGGGSACNRATPLLPGSQVCDCPSHPPPCSLLEAEEYLKPGLLPACPVCAGDLLRVLCP